MVFSSLSCVLVLGNAQQFSACPASASSSSSHLGGSKPPPRPPRSWQMASLLCSGEEALAGAPHQPPGLPPLSPHPRTHCFLSSQVRGRAGTSSPTLGPPCVLPSLSPAPHLTLPLLPLSWPVMFLYFKVFILERVDIDFVSTFHSCFLPVQSDFSPTTMLKRFSPRSPEAS